MHERMMSGNVHEPQRPRCPLPPDNRSLGDVFFWPLAGLSGTHVRRGSRCIQGSRSDHVMGGTLSGPGRQIAAADGEVSRALLQITVFVCAEASARSCSYVITYEMTYKSKL